jgi:hypothetical protein
VRFQILNKRFYNGIIPHWFAKVRIAWLIIRYTKVSPSSRTYASMINIEFPSEDYIEKHTNYQTQLLKISGLSKSTGGFNILLSTGEQSKFGDWKDQQMELIRQSSKVSRIQMSFHIAKGFVGYTLFD